MNNSVTENITLPLSDYNQLIINRNYYKNLCSERYDTINGYVSKIHKLQDTIKKRNKQIQHLKDKIAELEDVIWQHNKKMLNVTK